MCDQHLLRRSGQCGAVCQKLFIVNWRTCIKLRSTGTGLSAHRSYTQPVCCQVAWVPGSFELPVVAKCMAKSGKFDAVVAIGAVVRFGSCGS